MALDSGAGELLARFITQKSYFRPSDKTVKHSAFMPPATGRLSVYQIWSLSDPDIWDIGERYVAPLLAMPLLGRADFNSLRCYECGLRVEPTPTPHPRHANVVGWDSTNTETRLIAIKLARQATLKLLPPRV